MLDLPSTNEALQGAIGVILAYIAKQLHGQRKRSTGDHVGIREDLAVVKEQMKSAIEKLDEITDTLPRIQRLEGTVYGSGLDGETGLVSKQIAGHKMDRALQRDMDIVKYHHPEWRWPAQPNL